MSSRSGWAPGGPSPSSTRGTDPASATSGPAAGPAGETAGGSGPSSAAATTCSTTANFSSG
eukprot:4787895-Alexandrium_andersonii.AAC.1